MVAKIGSKFVRKSVLHKAKFDIKKLNPVDYVGKCHMPALFVIAKGDDIVRPYHCDILNLRYAGPSNVIRVEGDHNSDRP